MSDKHHFSCETSNHLGIIKVRENKKTHNSVKGDRVDIRSGDRKIRWVDK